MIEVAADVRKPRGNSWGAIACNLHICGALNRTHILLDFAQADLRHCDGLELPQAHKLLFLT